MLLIFDVGISSTSRATRTEAKPTVNNNTPPCSMVSTQTVPDSALAAIVTGCPGQLIEIEESVSANVRHRMYSFRPLSIETFILPHHKWPDGQGSLQQPLNPSTDVLAHFRSGLVLYEENRQVLDARLEPWNIEEVNLGGMSGGGIWLEVESDAPRLWRPSCALIGLDKSVNVKEQWIRGTLIDKWLELVHLHYPDLRECVTEIRARAQS